ncbi:MAG: YitT family protein [Lachnospiraceae bacterium]
MKRTLKETVLRAIILLVGLLIAHLGVTLFLLADLGSDPFNVLVQGLFHSLENLTGFTFLSHGRVHIAVCFLIILVLLIVDRTYVKLGTIICMICGGPIIDMYSFFLAPILADMGSLIGRLLMLVAGCVILAYGMTIVIKSDAGTGPNDLVAVVISDKLHSKFGITRIAVDVCFVVIGYLLGGLVGIGTIICAFCVGPVASHFLPINERIIGRILKSVLKKEAD